MVGTVVVDDKLCRDESAGELRSRPRGLFRLRGPCEMDECESDSIADPDEQFVARLAAEPYVEVGGVVQRVPGCKLCAEFSPEGRALLLT